MPMPAADSSIGRQHMPLRDSREHRRRGKNWGGVHPLSGNTSRRREHRRTGDSGGSKKYPSCWTCGGRKKNPSSWTCPPTNLLSISHTICKIPATDYVHAFVGFLAQSTAIHDHNACTQIRDTNTGTNLCRQKRHH
jgi:hypothetical protein